MDPKLLKMMREGKKSRRTQSAPNGLNSEQTTSRIETPKCPYNKVGELDGSDSDNQENEIPDNHFTPSGSNELRTLLQRIFIRNLDLDDTLIVNEDRIGDNYHRLEP